MALTYGFVRSRIASTPKLQAARRKDETQYHLHVSLNIVDAEGNQTTWDCAINVGTNDSDDLLLYRLIYDFHHPVLNQLRSSPQGFNDLTGTTTLPALDFLRSDLLSETGSFRQTDVMDGSGDAEPVPSLTRLLMTAKNSNVDVYIFGRTYTDGNGIHDIHMNQGSTGSFINGGNDKNDHNDVWQDGGVIVDLGDGRVGAYFTAFTQQSVPTDNSGNPADDSHELTDADVNKLTHR
jgi:uncharacterized protein YukJ